MGRLARLKMQRRLRRQGPSVVADEAHAPRGCDGSRPAAATQSPLRPAQEADRPQLTYDGVRQALRCIALEREQWAGIPMPLDGKRLVVEPRFPNAKALMQLGGIEAPQRQDRPDYAHTCAAGDVEPMQVRNRFWSAHKTSEIVVVETSRGITWGMQPGVHHLNLDIETMTCAEAWGWEQEARAIDLLERLIPELQMRRYMMTGMFVERSRRSGVLYIFRRLRPTVALSDRDGKVRVLACLCLHPIGYYAGSWGGAMVPTDDVVAHLMLMRGDEAAFWRRSSQHPPWRPEAGL